jgi:hypothetical protein
MIILVDKMLEREGHLIDALIWKKTDLPDQAQ